MDLYISSFISVKCFFVLVFLLSVTNCDDRSIAPFEEDAGFFSVYGALDADNELNYIRVKNSQISALPDTLNPLEGTVTFTHLEEGKTTSLRDTIVDFSGFKTHNFIVNQKLEPANTYEVTVEGHDGKSVSTVTTIPRHTKVSAEPSENVLCSQQIEFVYGNVEYPEHIQMEVGVRRGVEIEWSKIGLVADLEHRKDRNEMVLQMSPINLLVELFPPRSIPRNVNPRELAPSVSCGDIFTIYIRYTHYGKEWDLFRPGWFPVDPLSWRDVENGLGFMGSFRQDTFTITR